MAFVSCFFVLWVSIMANDIFILMIDSKRNHTYLGCLAAQATINIFFATVLEVMACIALGDASSMNSASFPTHIVLGIAMPVSSLCSLCLLIIIMWPVYLLRPVVSLKQIWVYNTKDILAGTITPLERVCHSSILGHPRSAPLSIEKGVYTVTHALWVKLPGAIRKPISSIVRRATKFTTRLFFRRISPVETMVYAFTRNSFAVGAMGILIFRTITALIQAQNQTGTRMISTGCSTREDDRHNVQILVGHVKHQDVIVKLNLRKKDNSGAWSDDYITEQCSPDKEEKKVWESANGESIVDHYECEKDHMYMVKDTVGLIFSIEARGSSLDEPRASVQIWLFNKAELRNHSHSPNPIDAVRTVFILRRYYVRSLPIVFSIEARGSLIDEPRASVQIWLFNKAELRNHSHSPNPIDAVRTYLPSWELRPGFHIDSDSRLITRKFITSSIMKDVVLNSEPEYEHVSLYPIFETSVSRYTNQSTPIATAMINLGFKPGFTHSRSKVDLRAPIFIPGEMCDYIEDYRTGTILDVIGSVGGLFALLQAIHVFLFGRPLFWGLTGAKLIAPFGLLGACSSRGFKRRLREQYHKNTTDENEDTIRLDAFLRDFVVDFGPADFHHEERQLRQSTSYLEVPESDDALSATPISLVRMESGTAVMPQENDDG
ncbi:unnamed protein product [Rhizoctonia solani]|uniref:Transmembrane protein n=1 Tax=Rhizoctonia solani TaxID=456999 RepID=A0A8H3HPH5_9AGAM|nr:unnamed protein product [Rhizoctonia solani]